MDEGLQLLYEVIEYKINQLSKIDNSLFILNDIDLVELYSSINDSPVNISNVTDDIIKIIYKNKTDKQDIIKKVRDLYFGMKDYSINVIDNKKYYDDIEEFNEELKKYLLKIDSSALVKSIILNKCNELKTCLKNEDLIEDIEFIKEIVKEYDNIRYGKNMLEVINYVTIHNLKILNSVVEFDDVIDINVIKETKLDQRILDMLKYMKIKYEDLPANVIKELKVCNVDEVIEVFSLIKQNRAENYGILHLINKNNYLAKLYLVLYSTKDSVINVVDSLRDDKDYVDMKVLKKLINNAVSSFFVKENVFFKARYEEYINNIKLLKTLGVNYKSLITKCTLFMVTSNSSLFYTLECLYKYGADKKQIINYCYKTLTLCPNVLIDNVYLLIKNKINVIKYFSDGADKFNLLKTKDLGIRLDYIINKYNLDRSNLNIDTINKLMLTKIFKECDNSISWSV